MSCLWLLNRGDLTAPARLPVLQGSCRARKHYVQIVLDEVNLGLPLGGFPDFITELASPTVNEDATWHFPGVFPHLGHVGSELF